MRFFSDLALSCFGFVMGLCLAVLQCRRVSAFRAESLFSHNLIHAGGAARWKQPPCVTGRQASLACAFGGFGTDVFSAFAHSFLHQDACAELCDQAHALRDVELFQAPSSSHSDTTQLIFSFLLLLHPSSFALLIMSSWDGT